MSTNKIQVRKKDMYKMKNYEIELKNRIEFIKNKLSESHANGIIFGNSGGKDSEVLLDLALKAKIPMIVANSHTTADAPETVRHKKGGFNSSLSI